MVTVPRTFLWTRQEYERLVDDGYFDGRRVELIDGEVVEMPPMRSHHAAAVRQIDAVLHTRLGVGYCQQAQLPLAIGTGDEPEPDFAVLAGVLDDYVYAHPSTAALVIEVSDTTLAFDRTRKAAVYARGGIPDYWIVNLVDAVLEVHREPRLNPDGSWHYALIERLDQAATVTAVACSLEPLAVADLFPRGGRRA